MNLYFGFAKLNNKLFIVNVSGLQLCCDPNWRTSVSKSETKAVKDKDSETNHLPFLQMTQEIKTFMLVVNLYDLYCLIKVFHRCIGFISSTILA